MKTRRKWFAIMLISALLLTSIGIAQEKEKKSYAMVEITYMMPKIGMEKAFVNSVKEHNNLYHKEGPFQAHLDNILTSNEAGWYVWIMGPCMFTDLDNRPDDDAHTDHWTNTVAPNVKKYGRSEYWRYNEKLSYKFNDAIPKYENVWIVDLKRGDYYRFKALMKKIAEAYKKKNDDSIYVYDNQFNAGDGRDVAIIWGFNSWAELDDEDGGIKKQYEEMHGEGSWTNLLEEWEEITESIVSQVWKIGI